MSASFISEEDYENPNLPDYVHPSSRVVAEQIIELWRQGKRTVLLKAQMQCGKTSVIRHICYLINVKTRFLELQLPDYDRVYVLNNIADNALRSQTRERLKGVMVFPDMNVDHSISRTYTPENQGNILDTIKRDRVLISDESHCGTEKYHAVATIMDMINNPLYGNPQIMEKNNTYLLLVSATQFAESGVNSADKAIVELVPTPGYFGIEDMLDEGNAVDNRGVEFLHHPADDYATFKESCMEFLDYYGIKKGFVFIRAQENN
jgi:hypothetical protein